MKTRRVGSLTCGALLIIFGVLFMVHMFVPALKYEFIIKFWPVILIALGVEMLLSCRNKEEGIKLKYDGAAIFLTILLGFFAMEWECCSIVWRIFRCAFKKYSYREDVSDMRVSKYFVRVVGDVRKRY